MRKHKTFVHKAKASDRLKVTFNAAEHAEGVLPTCAFCHHKFDHWDGLKHHIELDRCTKSLWTQARRPSNGLSDEGKEARGNAQQAVSQADKPGQSHDTGQEAPNCTKEPPVRDAPGIIALLQDKDWTSIPDSPYAEKLRQHCCICSRWIVDPTALKRHLKQAHKATWAIVHSELDKQCENFKSHLIRDGICPCCQRTSYSRHFKQCNVIFQSAVIGVLHQHGGTGERSVDVRPSAAGTGSPGQPAQPSGCGGLSEEQPDTSQEGQNKERPAADQTSHVGRHASRNSQPTGCASTVEGLRGVEQEERQGRKGGGIAHCHPAGLPNGGKDKAQAPGSKPTGHGRGKKAGVVGRAGETPVHALEPRQQKTGTIHAAAASPDRRRGQHPPGTPRSGEAGPDHPLLCLPSPAHGAASRGQSSVYHRGSTEIGRSQPLPCPDGTDSGEQCLDARGSTAQSTGPAAVRLGSGVAEADGEIRSRRQALPSSFDLRLQRLINRSNTCYINSSIFAIMCQDLERNRGRALPLAWRQQLGQASWYPPSLLRFHLLTWRDMHRQHDAAEFLQFLLPKLSWVPCRHEWSARLEVNGACRRESGNPQEYILGLTPPDGLQSSVIQDTVDAWHRQLHTHALHSAPDCIFLQLLPRFREHDGVLVKHRIPLDLHPPTLHLPVFRNPDSLVCDWTEYHIHAAIASRRGDHQRPLSYHACPIPG